jgi:hypothetical protein
MRPQCYVILQAGSNAKSFCRLRKVCQKKRAKVMKGMGKAAEGHAPFEGTTVS